MAAIAEIYGQYLTFSSIRITGGIALYDVNNVYYPVVDSNNVVLDENGNQVTIQVTGGAITPDPIPLTLDNWRICVSHGLTLEDDDEGELSPATQGVSYEEYRRTHGNESGSTWRWR